MLKCPICGMIINEKNYSFNENAFLIKNTKNNILYCPFCGVDAAYLYNEQAFLNIAPDISDKETSVILNHAMKLEVYNGNFYKIASGMTCDKNKKELFEALSNIEMFHAGIHKKLGKFNELPILADIDYSSLKGDTALLREADQREVHAVAYYKKYYSAIKDINIKYIFEALMSVEKGHISLLESAIK